MKLFAIITICLCMCTLGFAQDAPIERNLPLMIPSQCSAPAQISGQVAVDNVIVRISEAKRTFQDVGGGCGHVTLTEEQRSNFPALLLADVRLDQPGIECNALNSSNIDEPFGLSAEVMCSKTITPTTGEAFMAYLVIGIKVDKDGEVIVYFVSASE